MIRHGNTRDICIGVLYHTAVLHIQTADLGEGSGGAIIVGEELGGDGEFCEWCRSSFLERTS